MKTNYAGIDYGLGQSNVDSKTGIRYGVISQNSVMPEAMDEVDYDYGDATCPTCGQKAQDSSDHEWADKDYCCPACQESFWSDRCFSDEALGWSYQRDGYKLCDCLNNDIFVLASPFFTYAQFCSPCVPGAGNLDSPLHVNTDASEVHQLCADHGIAKTFCLGHDWFEGGKAPYPVYSVETGELVNP